MPKTETHVECVRRWERDADALLVGRKITGVRYMSQAECDAHGWTAKCLIIQLDNDVRIYASRDDEGNDAGALFTDSPDLPTIPVIRDYARG